MRIASIAATLVLAAPVLLSAQTPSSSTRSRVVTSSNGTVTQVPETVYVKGNVYGIVPSGSNYVITGSKTSFKVDTIYTATTNASGNAEMNMSTATEPKSDLEKTADKAGKDISNEAKRTPKNVSKTAKKVGHGVKEAASDVKKAVTGKP